MDLQQMPGCSSATERNEENDIVEETSIINTSKRKRRAKMHPVWEKFKEVQKPLGRIIVCKKCSKELRIKSNSTVLMRHWTAYHKDEPLSSKETSILSEESNDRVRNIEKAFVRVLAIPSISVNSFLHSDVRKLFSLLNPSFQIPKSHATLKSMLVNECNLAQVAIKQFIKSAKSRPSLICDVWSNSGNTEGYLGVTLTMCDHSSLRYIFIGAKSLNGSHTAYLLRRETESILANYDLKLDDMVKIVTDSGANIVAAFKDVFDDANDDEQEAGDNDDENADFGDIDEPEGLERIADAFPKRIKCFAHVIQLIIMHTFKNVISRSAGFQRMCKLILRIKHSVLLNQRVREESGKMLLAPSKTRWGSFVYVIGRFLELREVIFDIADEKRWERLSLDHVEFLKEVHKMMLPFVEAIKKIQAQKTVTISRCLGYAKALLYSLDIAEDDLSEQSIEAIHYLRGEVKQHLEMIYMPNSEDYNPVYLIAAALDPYTAGILSDAELNTAADWICKMLPSEQFPRNEASVATQESSSILDDILFKLTDEQKRNRDNNSQLASRKKSRVVHCLHTIQNTSRGTDPIKYWNALLSTEWDAIALFALDILSISGMNAYDETIMYWLGMPVANYFALTPVFVFFLTVDRCFALRFPLQYVTHLHKWAITSASFVIIFVYIASTIVVLLELPIQYDKVQDCIFFSCTMVKYKSQPLYACKLTFGTANVLLMIYFLWITSACRKCVRNSIVKVTLVTEICFNLLPGYVGSLYLAITGVSTTKYLGMYPSMFCSIDAAFCGIYYVIVLSKKKVDSLTSD